MCLHLYLHLYSDLSLLGILVVVVYYTTMKCNFALYKMHNVGDKRSQSTCMSLVVALS